MKYLKSLKRYKYEIKFFVAFVVVFFMAPWISFTFFYSKTNAGYRGLDTIRGATLVLYEYKANGKKYEGNFELNSISSKRFEKFKKGDSLVVRHITFLPFFSRYQAEDNK